MKIIQNLKSISCFQKFLLEAYDKNKDSIEMYCFERCCMFCLFRPFRERILPLPTDALFGPSPKQQQQPNRSVTSPMQGMNQYGGFPTQQNQGFASYFDPLASQHQNGGFGMNPNVNLQRNPPLPKNQVLAQAWEALPLEHKRQWQSLTPAQQQQWCNGVINKYLGSMGMMGHTTPESTWGMSQQQYAGYPQQQAFSSYPPAYNTMGYGQPR
jgi:hypothetical protein